jgi:hypothetical protein
MCRRPDGAEAPRLIHPGLSRPALLYLLICSEKMDLWSCLPGSCSRRWDRPQALHELGRPRRGCSRPRCFLPALPDPTLSRVLVGLLHRCRTHELQARIALAWSRLSLMHISLIPSGPHRMYCCAFVCNQSLSALCRRSLTAVNEYQLLCEKNQVRP